MNQNKDIKKLKKKESDVGMLLTGLQALRQAACRDAGQWSLAMKQAV